MSIKGNTVGTTTPRPDWNQNDSKKADFIKNKPTDQLANADAHLKNKNNPHGVTLAQVGAAPASHTTDKSNPHGVTPAQIGALPISGGTMTGPLTLMWQNLTGFRALNGVRMGAFRFDHNTTCHIFNVKSKWSALVALSTNTYHCALYLLSGTSENSMENIIKIAGTEHGTLGFEISEGIITVTCYTEWSNAWYITSSFYEDQVPG